MERSDAKLTGFKKRQQIAAANKLIFVWVAVGAVVITFCCIILQFLIREGIFNQKIINAKGETNAALVKNIETAGDLKTKVDNLVGDSNLALTRANPNDSNLQVVLDALPVKGDATSFANSLQQIVFAKSGVTITDLNTTTNTDDTALTDTATATTSGPQELPFNITFTGSYDQVKQALKDSERVIRPINPQTLNLQAGDGGSLKLALNGMTYYLPSKTVNLGSKTIKP